MRLFAGTRFVSRYHPGWCFDRQLYSLNSCALQMHETRIQKSGEIKTPTLTLYYGSSRQSYYIHAKQFKLSKFGVAKIRITQTHFLKRKENCFHILLSLWCSKGNHANDSCCFSSQEATLWNESRNRLHTAPKCSARDMLSSSSHVARSITQRILLSKLLLWETSLLLQCLACFYYRSWLIFITVFGRISLR